MKPNLFRTIIPPWGNRRRFIFSHFIHFIGHVVAILSLQSSYFIHQQFITSAFPFSVPRFPVLPCPRQGDRKGRPSRRSARMTDITFYFAGNPRGFPVAPSHPGWRRYAPYPGLPILLPHGQQTPYHTSYSLLSIHYSLFIV